MIRLAKLALMSIIKGIVLQNPEGVRVYRKRAILKKSRRASYREEKSPICVTGIKSSELKNGCMTKECKRSGMYFFSL